MNDERKSIGKCDTQYHMNMNANINTNIGMTQMLELSDKDLKTININMLK